ncbi:MAG TPA: pyridoxamine 5'-phosphate oxidase family protein [Mycobacteriales bacterium]|jgi:hypothetical protein|nr:pyridoxamine 5'-phosphate oxidase family protein [Mycobacteriales bacterium]
MVLMKLHERIESRLHDFILAQPLFFVGTAPTASDGHINVSPKGMQGTFAILDPLRVAYLDYTGSGAETHAHLRDNGRIVLMFCAFSGPPDIIRLHGRGRTILPGSARFDELLPRFGPPYPGLRSVIEVAVERVSSSCGFSVPFMEYVGDRDLLRRHWERKGADQLPAYWEKKNSRSIDGLPALDPL